MKISFEGSTLSEILCQILNFSREVNGVKAVSVSINTPPPEPIIPPKKAKAEKKKEEPVVLPPEKPVVHNQKIEKTDLMNLLQKVCEKEDAGKADKVAGITKVRDIFKTFGIARLGELDEKRFHEMKEYIERMLA